MEKLRSFQEFKQKTNENLYEAYTRMRRLITITQGVTKAQVVQFSYGILDKELRRRIRDVILMSDDFPTLAHVFALFEKIELNMVEERVVTFGFSRNIVTTSRGQQSTSQLGRGGGGGRGTPMIRAPPTATPPPTIEVAMAVRIEQLEQRLTTMASLQHRSHFKKRGFHILWGR
jgi:hypothetical protein